MFDPEKVNRYSQRDLGLVVQACDYDHLVSLYRDLLSKQVLPVGSGDDSRLPKYSEVSRGGIMLNVERWADIYSGITKHGPCYHMFMFSVTPCRLPESHAIHTEKTSIGWHTFTPKEVSHEV